MFRPRCQIPVMTRIIFCPILASVFAWMVSTVVVAQPESNAQKPSAKSTTKASTNPDENSELIPKQEPTKSTIEPAATATARDVLKTAEVGSATDQHQPESETILWRVGSTVKSSTYPLKTAYAILPVPNDWPEQQISLHSENISQGVRFTTRELEGGVRQALVEFPGAPAGQSQKAFVTFKVIVSQIPLPEKTEYLAKPRKPSREISRYLNASPLINHRSGSIKNLATEITKEEYNDWGRVLAMHDWVRANIELSDEEPKGAVKTLQEKKGCREDRINLFIALCRCQKIPARTVWADRYEYAEFYLVDPETEPKWFPCQLTGPVEFGELRTLRMIEQKGENIQLPEQKEKVRFVIATGNAATVRPSRSKKTKPSMRFHAERIFENNLDK